MYNKLTGNEQWNTKYDGAGNGLDRGWAIASDQFENIYVTGESKGASSMQDMLILGYDNIGRIRWTGRYEGGANRDDVARVIGVDKSGYVYSAGYSTPSIAHGFDATTLKYCPPPPANAGSNVTICKGSNTQLNATGGANYLWSPVTNLSSPNISNPVASPKSTTSYVVSVDNNLGCTSKDTVVVTVNPQPNVNVTASGSLAICQGESVTLSVPPCTCTYQWMKGSANIPGATTNSYTASAESTYKVVVTNEFGCSKTSKGLKVTVVCKDGDVTSEVKGLEISVSPNPTSNFFEIKWYSNSTEEVSVDVFNILGTRLYHLQAIPSSAIQLGNNWPDGVYIVQVTQESKKKMLKVIKEN
jgi:hypothetical protein